MTNGFHKEKASPANQGGRPVTKSALTTEKQSDDASAAGPTASQQNSNPSVPTDAEYPPR
jgi:hypothetical protein